MEPYARRRLRLPDAVAHSLSQPQTSVYEQHTRASLQSVAVILGPRRQREAIQQHSR